MKKKSRNECIICGEETKRHTTKTCSIECRGKAQIKNKEKACLVCSTLFKPHNKDSKYCSLKCNYKSMIGREFSEEHKRKISKHAKTRTGKKNPMYGRKAAHGRGHWHTTPQGKRVWLRSSWEKRYAEYLDKLSLEYEVEPGPFKIEYNNKDGTYRPDFYIKEKDIYIEIKGWWRDDAKDKFNAFVNQYPKLKINLLTSKELDIIGVTKNGR